MIRTLTIMLIPLLTLLTACSTGPVEPSIDDSCLYHDCTYPGYTGPARSEESPIDKNNRENAKNRRDRINKKHE